jgi:hypothetical protein
MITFNGGAKRSDAVPMFRKIPYGPLKRTALALTDGSLKYDEGIYDANWRKGDVEFGAAAFDHVVNHLYAWIEGDTTEDHLSHASAGLMFLMQFEDDGVFTPGNPPPNPTIVWPEEEEIEAVPTPDPTMVQRLMGLVSRSK